MNIEKINRLMFETMEGIAPLETSKVSMFSIDDIYAHLPFFRFRFKNKSKDDDIYKAVKNAVAFFNGKSKWRVVSTKESENFLILPSIVEQNNEEQFIIKREYYISTIGEVLFNKKIDECIEDIPKLAEAIGRCY